MITILIVAFAVNLALCAIAIPVALLRSRSNRSTRARLCPHCRTTLLPAVFRPLFRHLSALRRVLDKLCARLPRSARRLRSVHTMRRIAGLLDDASVITLRAVGRTVTRLVHGCERCERRTTRWACNMWPLLWDACVKQSCAASAKLEFHCCSGDGGRGKTLFFEDVKNGWGVVLGLKGKKFDVKWVGAEELSVV